ncbi:MAG TPA: FAD-binding protein [Gaiellaceae bacterium]|nr:FAD-binding protein [Gaiellaceae bacterium]
MLTVDPSVDFGVLNDRLAGDVVTQSDEAFDASRLAWNLSVDQQPVAVVYPEAAADVVAIVEFAAEHGLRVAFQGGGHNAGPITWTDHAILLKTERMRGIEIDPVGQRARVEAGVLADELATAAGKHGLCYLAGTSPDVGVVGYMIGGGISWMVRKYGLAANSILAAELVTADGQLRRVDAENDPDLFWAIRGGGGNFGAITALEVQLYPITEIYAGCLFWPIERAVEILKAWRAWIDTVPEECSSLGRLLKLPDLPFIPDHLKARDFVMIEPAFLGSEEDGAALVQPLRDLEPEFDTVAMIPTSQLSTVNMDPAEPVPYHGEGIHMHAFDDECIEKLVDVILDTPLMHSEVRQLGGAAGRSAAGHGALDKIDSAFTTLTFGLALDAEMKADMERHLVRLHETLGDWDSGFRYLNFAESSMDVEMIYPPSSFRRLSEIKGRVDPNHVFLANHPIRSAG